MRSNLVLAGSTAWVLLWASPGSALSPGTSCENAKLDAAARYQQCLIRAYRKADSRGDEPSEDAIAQCDQHFDQAFERAEADGACTTPGGASPRRATVRAWVQSTFATVAAPPPPCTTVYIEPGQAVCELSNSQSAIDLEDVLSRINNDPNVDNTVGDNTIIWIEAWGGNGGNGADVGGGGMERPAATWAMPR